MQAEINWYELSANGLLERINNEILGPLVGFRVYEYPEEGLVADNGVWEYSPEITDRLLKEDDVVHSVQQLLIQEGYNEDING